MGLEHDRREDLDPVGHQLAVARHAQLARLGVGAQPPRSLARHQPRLAVGLASSHRLKRLCDPAGDKLVPASGVRPLVQMHRPLARLASVAPGLLSVQQLSEAMSPIAVGRHAAVELRTVPRLSVVAVEADPRTRVLRARAARPRLAPPLSDRRHPSGDAMCEAGQIAQLEATGGTSSETR